MKTTLILLALCASLNAADPVPPATPTPKPATPAPRATPKPFPFTPSGALTVKPAGADGPPKVGGESYRHIKDGWYWERNDRGEWKKTTKVK
jgi:hypothetical protein